MGLIDNDEYSDPEQQAAWEGWQDRAAQPSGQENRNAVIEECAQVADRTPAFAKTTKDIWRHVEAAADEIAAAIRALKSDAAPVAAQPHVPAPLDYSTKNENYVTGWNDCRAAMLAVAPTPPADEHLKPDANGS